MVERWPLNSEWSGQRCRAYHAWWFQTQTGNFQRQTEISKSSHTLEPRVSLTGHSRVPGCMQGVAS
jgi:hypothetical protein